jgi:hypothetical protein
MELGGSLFSSTSWLAFLGPGRVGVEVLEVVLELEDVPELVAVLEDDVLLLAGPCADWK